MTNKDINKTITYKGYEIKENNGLIQVSKDGLVYNVALDDGKASGSRKVISKHNNIETAKKYIDWVSGL